MSNSHPAHRIGAYEGSVNAETYLGDCADLSAIGVQSCRADLEVILSGTEKAETLIATLVHAQKRLDNAKAALRAEAKLDVPALDGTKLATLTETYTQQLREAVKAARAEGKVTPELLKSAQAIARISHQCHVLAERLVPALNAFVTRQDEARRKKLEAAKRTAAPAPAQPVIKRAVVKPPVQAPANGVERDIVDDPTDKITDAELAALTARDLPPKEADEPLDIDDIMGILDEDVPAPAQGDTRITKG